MIEIVMIISIILLGLGSLVQTSMTKRIFKQINYINETLYKMKKKKEQ